MHDAPNLRINLCISAGVARPLLDTILDIMASSATLLDQFREAGGGHLGSFTRLLTGKRAEYKRCEEARRRWRLVRSKMCPGLASTFTLQQLHRVVRMAVENPGPQRYQEALQGPELEELKVRPQLQGDPPPNQSKLRVGLKGLSTSLEWLSVRNQLTWVD